MLNKILVSYRFIQGDLREGISYSVSKDIYNEAARHFGFDQIEEDTDSETYCAKVLEYTRKLEQGGIML